MRDGTEWDQKSSATGNRTRVSRVRAVYPNRLDYSGLLHAYRSFTHMAAWPQRPNQALARAAGEQITSVRTFAQFYDLLIQRLL